ncbi:MAG TPA: hypothetical protein VFA20_19825 [Myxococcaceae bacterium]|nr:hypothetical protein [Myxococcaceae bacterium]
MRSALAAIALALAGCAGSRPMDRDAFVREQMAALVLPRPIAEVWPLARELLSEQGYNGVDDPETLQYESEWREPAAPERFSGKLVRYRAQGIRLPEGRCRVVFTRFVRGKELGRGPVELSEGTRDFEMELNLYKKVDPDAAALLERRVSDPSSRR